MVSDQALFWTAAAILAVVVFAAFAWAYLRLKGGMATPDDFIGSDLETDPQQGGEAWRRDVL